MNLEQYVRSCALPMIAAWPELRSITRGTTTNILDPEDVQCASSARLHNLIVALKFDHIKDAHLHTSRPPFRTC